VHALDPDPSSPSSEPAVRDGRRAGRAGSADAEPAEVRARLAALETENAELLVEQTKLATERDILRRGCLGLRGI
jgi:hypothetical protein